MIQGRSSGPGFIFQLEPRTPKSGFSLIELLIVIGIISVLTGLLLAGYRNIRDRSKIQYCQNNLRELGMALNCYDDVWGGRLPPSTDPEVDDLRPLYPDCIDTFEIFLCLSTGNRVESKENLGDNAVGGRTGGFGHSYEFLSHYLYDRDKIELTTPSIKTRSSVDIRGDVIWIMMDAMEAGTPNKPDLNDNHFETGGNVLYADSHVAWVPIGLWDTKFKIGNSQR